MMRKRKDHPNKTHNKKRDRKRKARPLLSFLVLVQPETSNRMPKASNERTPAVRFNISPPNSFLVLANSPGYVDDRAALFS